MRVLALSLVLLLGGCYYPYGYYPYGGYYGPSYGYAAPPVYGNVVVGVGGGYHYPYRGWGWH
jgi:hypothetical protein